MKRNILALLLLATLVAWAQPATAGPACTMKTVTGTYAMLSYGSAWVGTADFFTTLALPYMPLGLFGPVTISEDGSVDGIMWGVLGPMNFGLNPTPFHATITIQPDCTGELSFFFFPEQTAPTIEQVVVLENGRALRGVSKETPPMPPVAWVTEYYRLGGKGDASARCHQVMARGPWLMTCEGFQSTPTASVSSAMLAKFDVDAKGNVVGRAMHKVGSTWFDAEMTGELLLLDDCTVRNRVDLDLEVPLRIHAVGMMFDSARQGFGMPLVAEQNGQVAPLSANVCRMMRR